LVIWARFGPTPIEPGLWDTRVFPKRSAVALEPKSTHAKGNRRGAGWIAEKAYEPIVPVKVEKRRAPATGGHAIHWREGGNSGAYRHGDTYPRR
jgi:hypothetical protein